MFVLVTICALVAHWYATRRRLAMAQDQFDAAMAGLAAGMAADREVYDASVKLLHAEQAVPFSSHRAACARHLELMKTLEKNWRNEPLTTTIGGDPAEFRRECKEEADKIHVWAEEAERWLDEAS